MTILKDYHYFCGVHWETASLHNAFAYQGIKGPHNDKPLSEALLLGISGGINVGYFTFAYIGYDPHVALLTRNTFDPFQRMCERLGIIQNVRQSTDPKKGVANLLKVLDEGYPAIVSADLYSLPYNAMPHPEEMWVMFPILVYGYDTDCAYIADRACVSLEITPEELAAARGRTKKNKYHLMTVESIDIDKLPSAVDRGIHDCINLFVEMPPKGARNNFGFATLKHWADALVQKQGKHSWAKVFPSGRAMYNGLVTTFNSVEVFGTGGGGSRAIYADFLEEAADILGKPALKQIAPQFRKSAEAWQAFADALLSDSVPLFKETRELIRRKQTLFREQGMAAVEILREITDRLEKLKDEATTKFPINETETAALLESLRSHLLTIHDIEFEAINKLEQGIR
jgi:hypothetical protein